MSPLKPAAVLALDLEGTLISNAMSCFPRPGLHVFLETCRSLFDRIVLFTAVGEDRLRPILRVLAEEGSAPSWLTAVERVHWSGDIKDLGYVSGCAWDEVLLVDDLESYVHPAQWAQWVPIAPFASPYPAEDTELARVAHELRSRAGRR